ncbi:MAG: DNA alkylation repair protein [Thermoplasmata archaeon]
MRMAIVESIEQQWAEMDRVMTPDVRSIAKKYFTEIKTHPKEKILGCCEELLETRKWELQVIAFQWAFKLKKSYVEEDFEIFERWLDLYVDGWGACDDLCTHALGELVFQYPEPVERVGGWTSSDNMWKRHAAAVTMLYSVHRGKHLDHVFHIADSLLHDEEELVQNGYGWMLKVASVPYRQEVYDYVIRNKTTMPRTSLRYAIEKMPEQMRKKAMEKN